MDKAVQDKKFINAGEQIQQRAAFEAWLSMPDCPLNSEYFKPGDRAIAFHSFRAAIELDQQGRGEPVAEVRSVQPGDNDSYGVVRFLVGDPDNMWSFPLPGTKLFLSAQPADPVVKDSLTTDEPVNHAIRIYNSGYMAGHQDTVEGCFTDILSADMAPYHEDVVNDLMGDLGATQPAEPVREVSVPEHLIERLRKHCDDKENTAFARSSMREALQYLTTAQADGQAQQDDEVDIYEDVYDQIVSMIEPYVQREYINPNGSLPASVVESTRILLEHWVKSQQDADKVDLQAAPIKAIGDLLSDAMDSAVANGADSRSMPDSYVEVAAWLCGIPPVPTAQPDPAMAGDEWLKRFEELAQLLVEFAIQTGDDLVASGEYTSRTHALYEHARKRVQPASGEGALYDAGWRNAALWADRGDLTADIGSAAYESAKSIAMKN